MSEQLYANEAATAAVMRFRNTRSGIELLKAHCDFLAAIDLFVEEDWIDRIIERVELAYECSLDRVNKV
jgi:hypothetical protein